MKEYLLNEEDEDGLYRSEDRILDEVEEIEEEEDSNDDYYPEKMDDFEEETVSEQPPGSEEQKDDSENDSEESPEEENPEEISVISVEEPLEETPPMKSKNSKGFKVLSFEDFISKK